MKNKKTGKKVVQNDIKTVDKSTTFKTKITLTLNNHFLEEFENICAFWSYSRNSGIVEAMRQFLVSMHKRKKLLERGKRTRDKWSYKQG